MMESEMTKRIPPTHEQSLVQVHSSYASQKRIFFFLDQPPPSFYRSSTGALRSQSSAILYLEEADTSRGPPRHRDQQRRVNWNANLVDQSLLRQPNRQTYVEHSGE